MNQTFRSGLLATLAGLALTSLSSAQAFLMMTNSTTDTLVSFSPVDGSIINTSMFALPNTTLVSAIEVNGEIWISGQLTDTITRYDLAGNVLGTIGPTFTGGGLDNIRGLALVNGIVYVSNSGTANGAPGNAVVMFDTAGNFISSWTTQATATSPFSVMPFQGDLLVAGSSNANDVHRFSPTGTSIGSFHNSAAISFAHQIAPASDGNVWCGCFTTGGITKLSSATGAVMSSFPAAGARGVFELLNGNVMWTNGSGAWVYDVTTSTSTLILAGGSYHLNLYGAAPSAVASQVGTGCDGLDLTATGVPSIGNSGFALNLNNISIPLGLFAFGSVNVYPGLDLTFLGMPGCFTYTNLDIGLFTGGPVVGGTSVFPLGIPNTPSLAGVTFAAQGVALSLATTAGLATSNGMFLLLN